ncbi:MAG: SpoIID/LytB domain-containing protein [Trueperaceae bacterium]|nr:SpoIID/LytB domain-containing protein [Trueperaceae bacterium]
MIASQAASHRRSPAALPGRVAIRPIVVVGLMVVSLLFSVGWAGQLVRVLLEDGLAATVVELGGPHEVRTVRGARTGVAALAWPLTVRDGVIVSDGAEVGPWLELLPENEVVRRDGRAYRGGLRVEVHDGALRVVNLVDLEAYLRGVVPSEMQAAWPIEALKAQAVAARSYTLASLDPGADYDICSTDACQVYRGMEVEHPRSDRAVADTEGIVIAWAGAPAIAYYHADSGGAVASSAEVWGRDVPYLRARTDVPSASPHRRWTVSIAPTALRGALAAEGRSVGTPTGLTILARSASGRVSRAEIAGDTGNVVVSGTTLTRVLRRVGLKSTRISSVAPLTVLGDGWGHGVGMSQYGARALALSGYDFGRILAYYYPGVGLQRRIYRASP